MERALHNEFPDADSPLAPAFHHFYWRRSPLGCSRPRPTLSRLRVKEPKRIVVPLLPVVMKLLGHLKPEMTMRYVEICLLDVQREFDLARSQPRHLLPASRLPASLSSPQANLASLLDSLHLAQHVLEMFRRTLPQGPDRRLLDRLSNRLTKIASELRKLGQG